MSGLTDPIDDRYRPGVRVNAWLHVEQSPRSLSKRDLLRALGIRGRKSYPVQARVKGERLVLRMEAHYSPFERQSRGALRSYLERPEAAPDVLQRSAFEYALDRWSIWINPSEHDVNPYTAVKVLTDELERRFGVHENEVYVVAHHAPPDEHGSPSKAWHLHSVVPARDGMNLDRKTMQEIGQAMVRELVLERAVERALDPERQRPAESGWDQPPTDAQLAVLHRAGRVGRDITRGEASLAIEAITGERSWAPRDVSRGR